MMLARMFRSANKKRVSFQTNGKTRFHSNSQVHVGVGKQANTEKKRNYVRDFRDLQITTGTTDYALWCEHTLHHFLRPSGTQKVSLGRGTSQKWDSQRLEAVSNNRGFLM